MIRRRLIELGFFRDEELLKLESECCSGVVVEVKGSKYALSQELWEHIKLERGESNGAGKPPKAL